GIVDRVSPRKGHWTLICIPSIVGALLSDVDLFPSILTDVGDVEGAKCPVEARAPGIAQAVRKNFRVGARRAHERIVGRYVIVAPGIARAVHGDTQVLAQQAVDVLPRVQGVAGAPAVTDRDVEIAVGPKAEPAALVIAERRLVDR